MSSKIIVGLDLGALTTKAALALSADDSARYEIVRTPRGSHRTPTSVSFPGPRRPRAIGEESLEMGGESAVGMLDRLLVGALGDGGEDPFEEFRRFRRDGGTGAVRIPGAAEGDGGGGGAFSPTALVAALLGRIRRDAISTARRLEGSKDDDATIASRLRFAFAVPPGCPTSTRRALTDAAYAASVPDSIAVDSASALGAALRGKKFDRESGGRKALVVEMGHARTNVSLLRLGGSDDGDAGIAVLSNVGSSTLGAGVVDICLYRHFLSSHPALARAGFGTRTRSAQRLLDGCKKIKHLLSMLNEGSVTVESIGTNEADVTLSANRELLAKLCEESVTKVLRSMMEQCIEKAGGVQALEDVASIELTGGGCRIPLVQDAIRDSLGKKGEEEGFAFSKSLDDMSLALGAAMTAVAAPAGHSLEEVSAERQELRETLLNDELAMAKRDAELIRKDEIRNRIEAHILELRSARHSAHSALLPTSEEFANHLDGADDWLFSEECDEATSEEMATKCREVESKSEELCKDYLDAERREAERKDREMEEEAKRAAAERDAEALSNGEDGDADDRDTRKLPTKRRMEIVAKNKAEANELFGDGNYKFAAARYAKALSHCNKFFDLSPDDEVQVKEIKLSLHVNMALAYIKLEKLDNAFQSCNEALALDPNNVKALYRRATVHHGRRKFDDALRDLQDAERLAPEDKAVKKLRRLVDHEMLKQKKKEQAMAKKMFG